VCSSTGLALFRTRLGAGWKHLKWRT
jgi:hypothetical protein